jgi:iron complex transport system substrate-binding protein
MSFFANLLLGSVVVAAACHAAADTPCNRIISLAPSVTEVVYELGLGSQLVGRTRFCRFPEQAGSVPEVGGFFDLSVEAIVSRKPTHIIALQESSDVAQNAARFGGEVLVVDHRSVVGIKESLRAIAAKCGVVERASQKLTEYADRERAVALRVGGQAQPRTLVVVGRAQEGSQTSALYVSGSDGFYTEVLALAGARNANESRTVPVPLLSPEGLLQLKPEAIVEVVNVDDAGSPRDARQLWVQFKSLPAVNRGAVFLVDEDYASIPGPRYISLVEKLAALLHPQPSGVAPEVKS